MVTLLQGIHGGNNKIGVGGLHSIGVQDCDLVCGEGGQPNILKEGSASSEIKRPKLLQFQLLHRLVGSVHPATQCSIQEDQNTYQAVCYSETDC